MASLDEPYLVTSYGITPGSSRPSKNADERFKLGVTSVIYRETSKAGKAGKQQSRRAIAVNTVQGNGIHLVDVSSSDSSFTLSENGADEILDLPSCRINHLCRRSQFLQRRSSPAKPSPSARKHAMIHHLQLQKLSLWLQAHQLDLQTPTRLDRGKLS